MKKIVSIIIVLGAGVVMWLVPACYSLLRPHTDKFPFVLYSQLDSDFIAFRTIDKQVHYEDFHGQVFTKAQADSLLPLFAYRQLLAEGRMPDSLYGYELTPKLIQRYTFHFKTSPRQLHKPSVGLYTMLESASGSVDLTLPPDVFRLTDDGLEFIDCETNALLPAKSRSFTRELKKKGFCFPVQCIWGNGTTRKDYDNGFLLSDSQEQLYWLRMQHGMPVVFPISSDNTHGWKQLFTMEPASHLMIGLAVTKDNRLYVIRSPHKENIPTSVALPIESYNPDEMQITIIGDLFHWTVTLYTDHDIRYYALPSDAIYYKDSIPLTLHSYIPDPAPTWQQKMVHILMPLRLHFTSYRTQRIFPTLNDDGL